MKHQLHFVYTITSIYHATNKNIYELPKIIPNKIFFKNLMKLYALNIRRIKNDSNGLNFFYYDEQYRKKKTLQHISHL